MEFNSALIKIFISTKTFRKTKTDKKDAMLITKYFISVDYNPHLKQFYHKYSLKSLSKMREKLVKQRSYYEVQITNVLNIIFPEYKPFFNNNFSKTNLYILNKYKTLDRIKNMKDFVSIRKISRGKFTSANFIKLRELAKNSIGISNDIFENELESLLTIHYQIEVEINKLENKIESIIKEFNLPILFIKGIGIISCAESISEFDDISRFKTSDTYVAFTGIEPIISQSGTESHTGHIVKHGSDYLKYFLINAADYVFMHESIFTEFYYKKRFEGKPHKVALTLVAEKIVRIIYKLESENITFNSNINYLVSNLHLYIATQNFKN